MQTATLKEESGDDDDDDIFGHSSLIRTFHAALQVRPAETFYNLKISSIITSSFSVSYCHIIKWCFFYQSTPCLSDNKRH